MIKFITLGGGGEIGANCYYLNISGTGIILDCGMHPQKTGRDSLPDFDLIKNEPVDFALISHAHQDHIGALPFLVQMHPYIKIITTPQTRAIAEITLHNSVSIMQEQITEDDKLKIYTHEEIDLLIRSVDYKSYMDRFELNGYNYLGNSGITACFYDAGHILGSAGILIEFDNRRLFYTGDINLDRQSILAGSALPEEKVDILIMETTYGSTNSDEILDWKSEAQRLSASINKILVNGGSILIPVFSLGKMQEIVATVWKLMESHKIPYIDIYTGGIARKISRIYDYSKYVVNRTDQDFEISSVPQKDLYSVEDFNEFFKNQCIVLAPSGMMLERTASYELGLRWLRQKDSAIFIVGYVDKETPGFIFANAVEGRKVSIADNEIEVKCTVEKFHFSAHSKREGLLEIAERTNPGTLILIHGEHDAVDWVGASILRKNKAINVYRAETGKEIILN